MYILFTKIIMEDNIKTYNVHFVHILFKYWTDDSFQHEEGLADLLRNFPVAFF